MIIPVRKRVASLSFSLLNPDQIKKIASPYTGEPMAYLSETNSSDMDEALQAAHSAFKNWSRTPIKERTEVLFNFRNEVLKNIDRISATKSFESGKTIDEAKSLFPNKTFRIRVEDGEAYIGDCAFYPNRINVELERKKIIKACIG